MPEVRRYRFGPLEPGGALGGLRWGQVAVLAAGLLAMVLTLHAASGPGGGALALSFALGGAGVAFVPVSGQPLEAWAAVAAAFVVRRLGGRHRYRSGAPRDGRTGPGLGAVDPPPALRAVLVEEAAVPAELVAEGARGRERRMGLVREGPYLTGLLLADGAPFTLLDPGDQERRVGAFGQALAALARPGGPVRRVQWLERTAAEAPGELGRYLGEELSLPASHHSVRSYIDLVDEAGPAARQHEIFLALQIDPRRGRRSGEPEALLARELAALSDRLRQAEVPVRGVLTARMVARAIRLAFEPAARPGLDRRAGADPEAAGVDPALLGPMAAEEGWGTYRTDGAWHASYWVAEWPRVPVGCDFLAPLLLGSAVGRTISLVAEPLDPSRALRRAESARTNDLSDEELRGRLGFVATARRRRQQEALAAREQEVADGHAALRFSGYVTVSADSPAALEAASAEVEQAAQLARLDLRRLWGEQEAGFTYSLPLCRGLR